MKRSNSIAAVIAVLAGLAGAAQTQLPPKNNWKAKYYTLPVKQKAYGGSQKASSPATIAAWNYTVTSPVDGRSYTATIVGRDVTNNGRRTTSIPAYVVPISMIIAGQVFDPTRSEPCIGNYSVMTVVAASPMFTDASWTFGGGISPGTSQYADAYQRVNFWSDTQNTAYHTKLQYHPLTARTITVPATSGQVNIGVCGVSGYVDIRWWDNYVTQILLPSLSGQATMDGVVVFQFASIVLYDSQNGNQCCILGYHSAVQTSSGIQTYLSSNFDASADWPDSPDVSTLSHEVAEWMVNPLLINTSPAWGHIGQEDACSTELEVADPLSGNNLAVQAGAVTLHVQDLAYLSWFFRRPPPVPATYSVAGVFRLDAGAVCH